LASAVTDETGSGALVFGTSPGFTTAANPATNGGAALGTTALQWANAFLASGGKIDWANGNIILVHSTGALGLTGGNIAVGNATPITNPPGGGVAPRVQALGTDSASGTLAIRYSADANGSKAILAKSRNAVVGSHTIVQDGDILGEIIAGGSNGTSFDESARIQFKVDGAPGATGDMPGSISFLTSPDGSASATIRMVIKADGTLLLATVPVFTNIPQNSQSAAYTTVLGDAQKHIFHPAADNNARTFTIDSNANVPYPIGTAITFVNEINTVTIAITSDTMKLAGAGTTGSRTLAANGIATALKTGTTSWLISGTGLT
jgi:hypothetical protein